MQVQNNSMRGQALIEYILIFSFLALISVGFVKSLNGLMNRSIGSLTYEVSEQLTVGVCERYCFFNGFTNQEK